MSKKQLTRDAFEEIVGELLNTRDFCGNEAEVMHDAKAEYLITEKQEVEILMEVDKQWNLSRLAARRACKAGGHA